MNVFIAFLLCAAESQGAEAIEKSAHEGSELLHWWASVEGDYGLSFVLAAGILSTVLGLFLCYRMYRLMEDRRSFWHEIPNLISHVPHSQISARHHIWAGVFLFSGLSLISGFVWAEVIHTKAATAGYMITNAGLALGILTLTLSFWTLYQTKRLERLQGEPIDRFDVLIEFMAREMHQLVDRYDNNRDKSQSLFRVYLVTNNPYFGVMSFPGKRVTLEYKNDFVRLAERVVTFRRSTGANPDGQGFKVRIICADEEHLRQFNTHYFDESEKNEFEQSVRDSEEFVSDLIRTLGPQSIVRIPMDVDIAQFAVVGDVVFEFFLESPMEKRSKHRGSNIRNTNMIRDRSVADRFERYASFLEKLILNSRADAAVGSAPAGPGGARPSKAPSGVAMGSEGASSAVTAESSTVVADDILSAISGSNAKPTDSNGAAGESDGSGGETCGGGGEDD